MPFSVVAYFESQDAAALANVAAVADPLYRVSGDDVFVPRELPNLAGYLFLGANFTQGQIWSPSLLQRMGGGMDVDQADLAAEPASPTNFVDLFDAPIALRGGEQLRALAAEDAAGAAATRVLYFLSSGEITPVEGDIISIRATGTKTLVADAWTTGTIALVNTLPVGRYAIVGARVQAAGLYAYRFIPAGGDVNRPGGLGCDADGDIVPAIFRRGGLGSWLEFEHDQPPQVEYLSVSADTAQTLILDVVRVGEGAS